MMHAAATRVTRRSRWRWDAWTLERYDRDPRTDIWFWVGRTWTRAGAHRLLRGFIADVELIRDQDAAQRAARDDLERPQDAPTSEDVA